MISSLTKENNDLKQGIKTLDANIDAITDELDKKTESLSSMSVAMNQMKKSNDEMNEKMNAMITKSNSESQRLFERENEIKAMRNTMAQYEGDINKMKAMLNERNKELRFQ